MWAPADDYYLPEYIKKNIDVLESDETVVSSTSDFRWFYVDDVDKVSHQKEQANNERTDIRYARSYYGTHDERVISFLKNHTTAEMYAIHRTDKLKEDFLPRAFWMWDHAVAFNMIKHGNFHALDEILSYKYTHGLSRGTMNSLRNSGLNLLEIVFLSYPFIFWCVRTFGIKILLKQGGQHMGESTKNGNIVKNRGLFFFNVFLRGQYIVIAESIRIFKRIIFRQEKHW
jgi:hypothetical protein